jgi:adenylate cyclase
MSYYTNPQPRPSRFRQLGALPTAISPSVALHLYELGYRIDVSPLLSKIEAPCLVLHREESRAIPVRLGRELAASIPHAHFVALAGAPHNPWEGDPAEPLAAIGDFLGVCFQFDAPRQPDALPELRTILFTDMEASTAMTQRLGDADAQKLVHEHNRLVRDALRGHGGQEIKHTGDGIMASFASASSAVECAIDVQRALAPDAPGHTEGVRVRIGINAGEPVAEDDDLFGTAVQLAKRVCETADPGQILTSNVIRELCAGKRLAFESRGQARLKGFEDPVPLFEVCWKP